MKLYSDPYAPNPRRVLWTMAEKGIADIEIVPMETIRLDPRQPDYVAMAGLPLVPALELDDGTAITESLAICRYLEAIHPEPNLFGRDPLETAIIEMWTRRAELLLANPLMIWVRNSHPALAELSPQSPHTAEANAGTAASHLPLFEARLGECAWLGGARFSIADIVAAAGVGFARMSRYAFPPDYPNLRRWWGEASARPGMKAGR